MRCSKRSGSLLGLLILVVPALAFTDLGDDLHKAARAGDAARVRTLIDQGAPVNHRDSLGGTPLHDAAWAGDREVVDLLIAHGADVNARHTDAGSTALHYAIITNHLEIVKLLAAHGADLKATYRSGSTPLHLAANRGF